MKFDMSKKYGRLTPKQFIPQGSGKHAKILCTCDCGKEKLVQSRYLIDESTTTWGIC